MFRFDPAISSAVRADRAEVPSASAADGPLDPELLNRIHRYWQAANYLTVGQIYLQDNL